MESRKLDQVATAVRSGGGWRLGEIARECSITKGETLLLLDVLKARGVCFKIGTEWWPA